MVPKIFVMFKKAMNFYMKVKYRKFLFFKPEFSNVVANEQNGSYGKMQNFFLIYLKLCLLGQKTGTRVVNATVVSFDFLILAIWSIITDALAKNVNSCKCNYIVALLVM